MNFPDAIGIAIESIESAEFLTEDQKLDIFSNNAARFLRLSEKEIALHIMSRPKLQVRLLCKARLGSGPMPPGKAGRPQNRIQNRRGSVMKATVMRTSCLMSAELFLYLQCRYKEQCLG